MPQFLPSFYEEAGRAFVLHGAPSFAATCFGKAREAEDVHALEVDEQHRVDAFLEFALAGAVTTKALAAYAKDLAEHHPAPVAYAHFRQLCVQRTLGGMPPWSGMAKELRRMAKAAKLDVAAEDASLIAEIVESPALGKASVELWQDYEAPLVALGQSSVTARQTLLDLFPTGTQSGGADVDKAWLGIVLACGGIERLLASPPGAPAAWFDKLVAHLGRSYQANPEQPFAILRTLAPRLAGDGVAIHGADAMEADQSRARRPGARARRRNRGRAQGRRSISSAGSSGPRARARTAAIPCARPRTPSSRRCCAT